MKKNYNISLTLDVKTDIYPITVRFENDSTAYDFSIFSDTKLVRIFAKAFQNRYAHYTIKARRPAFMHLKVFFKFFNEKYVHDFLYINSKTLIDFATWLDNNNDYSLKTKYRYYNNLEIFLKEIIKLTDSPLKNFILPLCPFKKVHTEAKEKNKLNEEQITKILKICYEKIDYSVAMFRLGRKIIENAVIKENLESNKIDEIVPYFYNKYGYLPSMEPPSMTRKEAYLASEAGGSRLISSYLHPTTESLLPFYLVLLIELAGNADAIKNIKLNCIEDDLIFPDRAFVTWDKPRAAKEQKRNILKNKKYGAYQIIQLLKEFTFSIRFKLPLEDQNLLFITRGNSKNQPLCAVQEHTFKNELKYFIKDNLDFNFVLSDLRPSILTLIYKKRKDIVAVSKIANHSNINTTLSYIVDKDVKLENMHYLSTKQDKLINELSRKTKKKAPKEYSPATIGNDSKNIGFNCKNPIFENKICINWMAELTNPNLIIPNSALYLAKILKLEKNIKEQKNYISNEKYKLLYEPVINMITNNILPNFDKSLIKKAKNLLNTVVLPSLSGY